MSTAETTTPDSLQTRRAIDLAIRIGILALLLCWCTLILMPFIVPVLWGAIIAIGVFPVFRRFRVPFGRRDKLAAIVFTLIALALLLTPTALLAESAISGVQTLSAELESGTLTVPPPPENVATWPVVGEPLSRAWSLASTNLRAAVERVEPQLREYGAKLLTTVAGMGLVVLQFVISIIISGVFLAKPDSGKRAAEALCARLAGPNATKLVDIAGATISSVVQGVLGVAMIQAILAGAGLLAADVPLAGLWALAVLVLAVVQLPTILVLGPLIVYVFSVDTTTTAVIFMVWSLLVGVSDTFLKPLFLGRGVDVPMLAVLLGAIGGMILHGIIGLFVGAVVLALTVKLYQAWLEAESQGASTQEPVSG